MKPTKSRLAASVISSSTNRASHVTPRTDGRHRPYKEQSNTRKSWLRAQYLPAQFPRKGTSPHQTQPNPHPPPTQRICCWVGDRSPEHLNRYALANRLAEEHQNQDALSQSYLTKMLMQRLYDAHLTGLSPEDRLLAVENSSKVRTGCVTACNSRNQ